MSPAAPAMLGSFGKKIDGTNAPDFDGTQPCREMDLSLFFPESKVEEKETIRLLKPVCDQCQFLDPCLQWAIVNREHGFWGGTTHDQRKNIIRRMRRSK